METHSWKHLIPFYNCTDDLTLSGDPSTRVRVRYVLNDGDVGVAWSDHLCWRYDPSWLGMVVLWRECDEDEEDLP